MNSSDTATISIFLVALGGVFLVWLIIRGIVLWYFRINRIVELLEHVEKNTRSAINANASPSRGGEVYYSDNGVTISNGKLMIPPNEWDVKIFKPVGIVTYGGKFRINLLNKEGVQVHYLESDNQGQLTRIAAAINQAIKG